MEKVKRLHGCECQRIGRIVSPGLIDRLIIDASLAGLGVVPDGSIIFS